MRTRIVLVLLAAIVLANFPVDAQWSVLTEQLSEGRGLRSNTVTLGQKVYFVGGLLDGDNYSKAIDIYDHSTNSWDHSQQLSLARAGIGSAVAGDVALFAGGLAAGGATNFVDIFHSNGQHSTDTLRGGPRYDMGVVSDGTRIYFGGGDTGSGVSDVVDIYDTSKPDGSRWSTAHLLLARKSLVAGVLDSKVYFVGGETLAGGATDLVDVWDGTNMVAAPPISETRKWGHVAASTGTKIFIAGGYNGSANTAVVDIIESGGGRKVTALSQARHILASTVVGDKVFFAGGRITGGPNSTVVDIYDLTTNNWAVPASLSQPRHDIGVATVGTKVLFAGGWRNDKTPDHYVKVIDVYDPEVVFTESLPTVFEKGAADAIASVTVDDLQKIKSVEFSAVGITTPEATSTVTTLEPEQKDYKKIITATDLVDPVGIIYSITITDFSDRVKTSTVRIANIRYSKGSQTIPSLRAGSNVSDYQIISVPLTLTNPGVLDAFADLAPYDPKHWRLFTYAPHGTSQYTEYGEGLSAIEPGKGYWLITRNQTVVDPGEGTTLTVTGVQELYYPLTLKPGMNLIGNPFNFKISWSKVITFNNQSTTTVSGLNIFQNGTVSPSDELAPFRGGFVENKSDVQIVLKIPASKALSGGRIASPEKIDLNAKQWQLPFSLTDGLFSNRLGGIGMNTRATLTGRDPFDEINVPLLEGMGMPVIVFEHPEIKMDFCKEIVPTTDFFEWEFKVEKSTENPLRIEWDPSMMVDGTKELFLFDPTTRQMKNMRTEGYYNIPKPTTQLRIYFGDNTYISQKKDELLPLFGAPFPNPAASDLIVPFHVAAHMGKVGVSVEVFDGMGKYVATIADGAYDPGDYQAIWKTEGMRSGLFVVQMRASDEPVKRVKIMVK